MSNTYTITEKTGYTRAHIFSSFEGASTFHSNRVVLDKAAVVAEAESIVEENWIRSHYELMPKRSIAALARAYEERMALRPRKRYVDIDLPIEDDDDGGDW